LAESNKLDQLSFDQDNFEEVVLESQKSEDAPEDVMNLTDRI